MQAQNQYKNMATVSSALLFQSINRHTYSTQELLSNQFGLIFIAMQMAWPEFVATKVAAEKHTTPCYNTSPLEGGNNGVITRGCPCYSHPRARRSACRRRCGLKALDRLLTMARTTASIQTRHAAILQV